MVVLISVVVWSGRVQVLRGDGRVRDGESLRCHEVQDQRRQVPDRTSVADQTFFRRIRIGTLR